MDLHADDVSLDQGTVIDRPPRFDMLPNRLDDHRLRPGANLQARATLRARSSPATIACIIGTAAPDVYGDARTRNHVVSGQTSLALRCRLLLCIAAFSRQSRASDLVLSRDASLRRRVIPTDRRPGNHTYALGRMPGYSRCCCLAAATVRDANPIVGPQNSTLVRFSDASKLSTCVVTRREVPRSVISPALEGACHHCAWPKRYCVGYSTNSQRFRSQIHAHTMVG